MSPGSIAHVTVFTNALSAAQVLALHNACLVAPPVTPKIAPVGAGSVLTLAGRKACSFNPQMWLARELAATRRQHKSRMSSGCLLSLNWLVPIHGLGSKQFWGERRYALFFSAPLEFVTLGEMKPALNRENGLELR